MAIQLLALALMTITFGSCNEDLAGNKPRHLIEILMYMLIWQVHYCHDGQLIKYTNIMIIIIESKTNLINASVLKMVRIIIRYAPFNGTVMGWPRLFWMYPQQKFPGRRSVSFIAFQTISSSRSHQRDTSENWRAPLWKQPLVLLVGTELKDQLTTVNYTSSDPHTHTCTLPMLLYSCGTLSHW